MRIKNALVMVVILLFIGVAVRPSIGLSDDDTTPPVTTYTLDPPEPDGLNGWYVSDITVTLNATDDMSGVKEIQYSINGLWGVIEGSNGTFVVTYDGKDIEIRYWAIDNAGNVEPKNTIMPLINLDQTPPSVVNDYEIDFEPLFGFFILFAMNATDYMSGMNRVEFYMDDVLQKNITGFGPLYEWICDLSNYSFVSGFILNPEITEEYVRFYAILVRIVDGSYRENIIFSEEFYAIAYDNAGNWDLRWYKDVFYFWIKSARSYMFESVTLPNSYKGYLGRFFVFATFDTRYQ